MMLEAAVVVTVSPIILAACASHGALSTPPIAAYSVDQQHDHAPLLVHFDDSASFDPAGRIVRYEWNFGDGETLRGVGAAHVFTDHGQYTLVDTIQDNHGTEDTATAVIEIFSLPPMARFTYSPQKSVVGQGVLFDASTSYDPAALGPKEVINR